MSCGCPPNFWQTGSLAATSIPIHPLPQNHDIESVRAYPQTNWTLCRCAADLQPVTSHISEVNFSKEPDFNHEINAAVLQDSPRIYLVIRNRESSAPKLTRINQPASSSCAKVCNLCSYKNAQQHQQARQWLVKSNKSLAFCGHTCCYKQLCLFMIFVLLSTTFAIRQRSQTVVQMEVIALIECSRNTKYTVVHKCVYVQTSLSLQMVCTVMNLTKEKCSIARKQIGLVNPTCCQKSSMLPL